MESFIERLIFEKEELDQKIAKLSSFINGSNFRMLDVTDQGYFHSQQSLMTEYSLILGIRLKKQGCTPESIKLYLDAKANANQTKTSSELTFGQKAVGLTFNPSGDDEVGKCKQGFADLIDQMVKLRTETKSPAQVRHASTAITDIETAQMRAVKALTWKD